MIRKSLLTLSLCLSIGTASAVEINADGAGQAVIVPLWATTAGHGTLFSMTALPVADDDSGPQIARVRLLDSAGESLFVATVYFQRASDQWSFALGSDGSGQSTLISNDATCVLVEEDDEVVPFSGQSVLAADYGYAVVIGMGQAQESYLRNAMANADCAALAARWQSDSSTTNPNIGLTDAAPGLLDVETSVINVGRGTLYAIPPTALVNFSDIPQHARPSSETPDLLSVHDAGTDTEGTTARRCIDGLCGEHVFSDPLDAVGFALSSPTLRGNYNINPNLGARTELIFLNPLSDEARVSYTNVVAFDASQTAGNSVICLVTPGPEGCGLPLVGRLMPMAVAIADDDGNGPAHTPILGLPTQELPLFVIGGTWAYRYPQGFRSELYSGRWSMNFWYVHTPIIALTIQEVTNGYVSGPDGQRVQANYGFTETAAAGGDPQ